MYIDDFLCGRLRGWAAGRLGVLVMRVPGCVGAFVRACVGSWRGGRGREETEQRKAAEANLRSAGVYHT